MPLLGLGPMRHPILLLAAMLVLCGCGRARARASSSSAPPVNQDDAAAVVGRKITCVPDPQFPGAFPLPEGSAAAVVELRPGVRELLVVADSGHDGDALAWVLPNGPSRRLRLGMAGRAIDDVEGIAWRAGHVYAILSTGYVQRYSPDGRGGLTRDQGPYPIGYVPYVTRDRYDTNGGKNYEGLCLRRPSATDRCVGYVASRAEGWLGCLVLDGERLRLDTVKPVMKLAVPPDSLSDCAFGAEGGPAQDTLLVTTNIFGGSTTYVVHEGTGALTPLDVTGLPTNEAIAVDRDGALYQIMDGNSDTSPALRAHCTGW